MIDSGWTGTLADRTIEASAGGSGTGTLRTLAAGSGTETLELVFENTAVAGSEFEPYSILVQCVGAGCVDDITEGEPTVITLSSFTAKPSAGGPASPLWLGLAGLTVLVGGSFVWTKRRAG
jgi:LPXTG-motif cell wall-anchored protein